MNIDFWATDIKNLHTCGRVGAMGDGGYSQIFVTRSGKTIPPDPGNPTQFDVHDARYWYRHEYAPWIVPRLAFPPRPRRNTAAGSPAVRPWRLTCLLPGEHPYFASYLKRMEFDSVQAGVELQVLSAGWDPEQHLEDVKVTVENRPDFVIYVAHHTDIAVHALETLHTAGIPALGSNMPLEPEAIRYVVGWTGPDSWSQSRSLARHFARCLGGEGGYVVIGHVSGTSENLARTYGVVSEVASTAPHMRCLAVEAGVFDAAATREQVAELIRSFGKDLRGIVSSDDNVIQSGIDRARKDAGRTDIKCVAHGSTTVGVRKLVRGDLEAITYQSAGTDGALAIQSALDWLSGLDIEAARFLPVHVIDRQNYQDFADRVESIEDFSADPLADAVLAASEKEVDIYFDTLLERFESTKVLRLESVKGMALEILSRVASLTRESRVPTEDVFVSFEDAYKRLVRHAEVDTLLEWLRGLCHRLIRARAARSESARVPGAGAELGDRLVAQVERRYDKPISLKTLSAEFGVSAPYLGRVFRKKTGQAFSVVLNSRRIEKAKELLRFRSVPAKDIALELGFNDPNYFYLVFKRITGKTVSAFLDESASETPDS